MATQMNADALRFRGWPQIRFASANGREWTGQSTEGEQEMATQMSADALRSRG
jgi:hypothetical protein